MVFEFNAALPVAVLFFPVVFEKNEIEGAYNVEKAKELIKQL